MATDVAPSGGDQEDTPRPGPGETEREARREGAPWWRLDQRLRHWRIVKKSLRRGVAAFLVALVIEYLVLPQIAGVNKDLHLLGRINVGYALLGVLLEVGAVFSYAALTRAVLPRRSASLLRLFRIDLSGLAVSHVLPGGTVGGTGVAYRLLTESGVSGADAGFGVATQGIGSAVVLNVILWLALVVSIALQGFNALYLSAAAVGLALFTAFGVLVGALTRGAERSALILGTIARHLPWVREEQVVSVVKRVAERVAELMRDRELLVRAVAWAAANWLLDAASLWVFVLAFHHLVGIDSLLVAYGLANVLAAIPITPGGLGVVEAVLIPVLVGFGTPRGIAILGVISYRLINFWLPIPAGALAYVSLRLEPSANRRREALRELRALVERPQ